MYSLEEVLDSLRTANRMLQGLRRSPDIDDQDEARYADIVELCSDVSEYAGEIAGIARRRSRELRRTSRTEREMIGLIVRAIEDEKPMRKHPSTNDVEAGGVKAKAIRHAGGKCELCGTTFFLTCHHIISRDEGGLNEEENLIVLCKSCHDEIEDQGYQTRAEIKRHVLPAKVYIGTSVAARGLTEAEERKAQKAREERAESEEVANWAEKWGDGFWRHVPYIALGDPVPPTPEWCLRVYGGQRQRH